ncbi:MAG: hypothetical protein JXB15_09740 [Anaerolineales bacterium]|nr:hypothetical protein [Anaerolineales bacterium]
MRMYRVFILILALLMALGPSAGAALAAPAEPEPQGLPGSVGSGAPVNPDALSLGPSLTIQSNILALPNSTVTVPIQFTANGNNISSIVFSLDFDETWLGFDVHTPMSITFDLPGAFLGSCSPDLTDTDGEIDCFILDPIAPLETLPNGNLATIKLTTLNAPNGTVASVNFSASSPPTSFGTTAGQSVPGTTTNGSVLISSGISLASLDPNSVMAGSPGFTLSVFGLGFSPGAVVHFGAVDLPTTYISTTQLNASVSAGYVVTPGPINVYVIGPAPTYQTSNTLVFMVTALNNISHLPLIIKNPPPAVTYTVCGQVVDNYGSPLVGVLVCSNTGRCATTNISGNYVIDQLPAGQYVITPSLAGYSFSPVNRTIDVPAVSCGVDFVGTSTSACANIIGNPGFEGNGYWEFPATEYTAAYSTAQANTGDWSARTGIVNPYHNRFSYSSTRQLVYIPANAYVAYLTFYTYPIGDPYLASNVIPKMPEFLDPFDETGILSGDVQYVLVVDYYGNVLRTLIWRLRDAQKWQFSEFNLLQFAGDWIYLHFGTYNDGYGGVSALYVDDVSLEVCR